MQPANNFVFYFIVIAALQGTALAVSLLLKKERSPANRILAIWLLCVVLDLAMVAAMMKNLHLLYPDIVAVKYGWPFLHGPFLYLYVRSLTAPVNLRLPDLWHFLPFCGIKLMLVSYLQLTHAEKVSYITNFSRDARIFNTVVSSLLTAHGLTYVILAFLKVKTYRARAVQFFSYKEKVSLNWLSTLLIINFGIWGIVGINQGMSLLGHRHGAETYIYTLVAIWIFIIGYFGFNQPEIFPDRSYPAKPAGQAPGDTTTPSDTAQAESRFFEAGEKYAKTKLSEARKEEIRKSLAAYMAEKPWLESTLTIKDISNHTGFPIHHISQVINDVFGENLFSFINKHRLDEAKVRLSDPEFQDINVLHIALDCGFNSKSSFNSIFKQHTGITPSEFRKQAYLKP